MKQLSLSKHIFAVTKVSFALCTLLALFIAVTASAVIEERSFADPELDARYQTLIEELRCLVCQNQNLADSNASLAKDLRDKTAEMLEAGKSDKEILAYMSDRYGDFVLYKPPFRTDTALLWVGPLLLLLLIIVFVVKRFAAPSVAHKDAQINADERRLARKILEDSSS